jgi:hypothetical protein
MPKFLSRQQPQQDPSIGEKGRERERERKREKVSQRFSLF